MIKDDKTGMDVWVYDGKKFPSSGLSAVAGKSKEEFSPEPLNYSDMRPGCYDPLERVKDMDRAGILASLSFPTITRFCGQLFMEASDREFGFTCLQAYNDWHIEEWAGAAPGRYIPLMLIPLWDPQLAAKEMERCAEKGVTSFCFSENPEPLGLPTIHDKDRYWIRSSPRPTISAWLLHARRLLVHGAPDLRGRAVHGEPVLGGRDPHLGRDADVAVQQRVPAFPQPQDRPVRG